MFQIQYKPIESVDSTDLMKRTQPEQTRTSYKRARTNDGAVLVRPADNDVEMEDQPEEVAEVTEQLMAKLAPGVITQEFIDECKQKFASDPTNILARNCVTTVGSDLASMDSSHLPNVTHIFLNSLKPPNIRATNQGSSGRCWMFAALNIFRYWVIEALEMDTFEFSEVYLFFWDKYERSNMILQWYIDHPNIDPNDRYSDAILNERLSDGGYWNYMVNLIKKYGLMPKDCMKETYQSSYSEDMNTILQDRLTGCVVHIQKLQRLKNQTGVAERIETLRKETMVQIYNILCKFLGNPPETFDWVFQNERKEPKAVMGCTPQEFRDTFLQQIDLDDFVVLCNVPVEEKPFYQTYQIRDNYNVIGGNPCKVLNVPIDELRKYAIKSIMCNIPVWFGGDVCKGYSHYEQALDEDLFNLDLLFGSSKKMSKGERMKYKNTEGNHAMTFTGVNFDDNGKTTRWQVENSWGYWDHEQPGLDGFLSASDKWFGDNVVMIVVHKNLLSRNVATAWEKEPVMLEPWDFMAPAVRIVGVDKPNLPSPPKYKK